ncbi:uncharacterized protein LOC111696238 [Eurytemora carolleeae]|uniref:uncharacterized protein LOC111696238 n=1 Tax=Eurytemora carolleeae TaxID=1294199 RepID=UPI000C77DBC8|nr:uncharacterized protein LOC111696238 [Eurytemora carolleeae]|eukprot:XP_023321559.1 uncharacterized protein LOC111696238 [Eurytemora affinis]
MDKQTFLVLLLSLPCTVIGWGEWDSVSCYSCGLPTIDPEKDEQDTYGTDPGVNKKMYNHSCDLMDNGLSGNYKFAGQELAPRTWVTYVNKSEPLLSENGTQITTCAPDTTVNGTVVPGKCTNAMREWRVAVPKPPKEYDMSMWIRKCPKGVRSCFKAIGNWDRQKPVFRGCSESIYAHPQTCRRELKSVSVNPAQPPVDVEVYLCFCSADTCNIDISSGLSLRFGLKYLIYTLLWILFIQTLA